jgi:hypothetical protein
MNFTAKMCLLKTAWIFAMVAGEPAYADRYCGPTTVIPGTEFSVNAKFPECVGEVRDQLGAIGEFTNQNGGSYGESISNVVADVGNLLDQLGMSSKTQSNANCSLVCAAYPLNERVVTDEIYWNDAGGAADINGEAYHRGAYGCYDCGPGWHRIDPDPIIQQFGSFMLYCHNFRNWLQYQPRSAVQCVWTD